MKTILVLTDFSENALNAAKAAVMLAGKIHANLILYHNFQTIPAAAYYAGGSYLVDEAGWIIEETKKKLNRQSRVLGYCIDDLDKTNRKPTLHTISAEGDLSKNIMDIVNDNDIEFMVMGARADSVIDHIFFGSETSAIIRHATRPVLVMPAQTMLTQLHKVAFATEFEEMDIEAVHYLIKLGKIFNFELNIIHVNQPWEHKLQHEEKEDAFKKRIAKFGYPSITYNDLRGLDVISRLERHCAATKTQLLALVHHQQSFFMRVLQHSTTKEALADQKIPLFILPSTME